MLSEVAAYVAARQEQERLDRLADAAFVRWHTGKVQSAAAATRAANRASYHSADLCGLEGRIWAAADRLGAPNGYVDLDLVYAWETS